MKMEQAKMNPWRTPEWMLLSHRKPATASSFVEGKDASKATNEDVRTWWRAASNESGEWLQIDLMFHVMCTPYKLILPMTG
ncbi:discoidin domain-containing protein [Paenibacillus oralis]|uniref:discoidin domain-containing protein n=1 Tax=Paenibacillus oralis TaxID=2490856 RepID=UPI001C498774|nr:discoidin domain-containing protein [Paenibacillus oralis]